ncbi:Ras-like protein [Acrasis kona]|uniref:Ras-like protein n=1 Tax=Acrasis kona TaxID=1008807 RepID=A0AAW2Z2L0_9EUKA
MEHRKVAMVGPGGVGKSAITIQFINLSHFFNAIDPTIEDSFQKRIKVDDILVNVDITDTAGEEGTRYDSKPLPVV